MSRIADEIVREYKIKEAYKKKKQTAMQRNGM